MKVRSNRFYDTRRFGYPQIRRYKKKGKGKQSPRLLLKCGDCGNKLEIYYGGDSLEIGGVHGAVQDWFGIFEPLLRKAGGPNTRFSRPRPVKKARERLAVLGGSAPRFRAGRRRR